MDAKRAQASVRDSVRRSRVVLTPRCWRQVGGRCPAGDGGKRAVHRGELEVSRKAIAQGRPECSRCPVCSCARFVCANRTRDRGCSAHPVFPAPSVFEEGKRKMQTSGETCREIAKSYPRHCERSEAIHCHLMHGKMDCFASARNDGRETASVARMERSAIRAVIRGHRPPDFAALIRATSNSLARNDDSIRRPPTPPACAPSAPRRTPRTAFG